MTKYENAHAVKGKYITVYNEKSFTPILYNISYIYLKIYILKHVIIIFLNHIFTVYSNDKNPNVHKFFRDTHLNLAH